MRAKWKPSPEQLEAAIDAAIARVPFERAAELIGVAPRTLKGFGNRLQRARAQHAVSSVTVGPLAPKSSAPVHSGIAAAQGRSGGLGA
jgi:hypothetical protein